MLLRPTSYQGRDYFFKMSFYTIWKFSLALNWRTKRQTACFMTSYLNDDHKKLILCWIFLLVTPELGLIDKSWKNFEIEQLFGVAANFFLLCCHGSKNLNNGNAYFLLDNFFIRNLVKCLRNLIISMWTFFIYDEHVFRKKNYGIHRMNTFLNALIL